MPYRKSRARLSFESGIAAERVILRNASAVKIRSIDIRSYVYSSVISRGSSHLELYIETVIDDWIRAIKAAPVSANLLRPELRAFIISENLFNEHTGHYVGLGDEASFVKKISSTFGRNEWSLYDDSTVVDAQMNLSVIIGTKRFPSVKNLKCVLRRLGIENPFSKLNSIIRGDFDKLLQSYLDLRNDFAHNGLSVGTNSADVRKKLDDLRRIASAIDKLMFEFVSLGVGSRFWT